jgi:hypothetical protein
MHEIVKLEAYSNYLCFSEIVAASKYMDAMESNGLKLGDHMHDISTFEK